MSMRQAPYAPAMVPRLAIRSTSGIWTALIAVGTPEEVAANERSYTGQALRPVLNGKATNGKPARPKKAPKTKPDPPARLFLTCQFEEFLAVFAARKPSLQQTCSKRTRTYA